MGHIVLAASDGHDEMRLSYALNAARLSRALALLCRKWWMAANVHLLKPLEKKKQNSSDQFLLTPTGEN